MCVCERKKYKEEFLVDTTLSSSQAYGPDAEMTHKFVIYGFKT
jgi:hypothetical protein